MWWLIAAVCVEAAPMQFECATGTVQGFAAEAQCWPLVKPLGEFLASETDRSRVAFIRVICVEGIGA